MRNSPCLDMRDSFDNSIYLLCPLTNKYYCLGKAFASVLKKEILLLLFSSIEKSGPLDHLHGQFIFTYPYSKRPLYSILDGVYSDCHE